MSVSLPPQSQHASADDWQVRIDSLARSGELVEVSATLWSDTDGDKFSLRFQTDGSASSLLAQARTALTQRPAQEARKSELAEGMQFALPSITPPDPVPPTDDELAARAFFDAWEALQALVPYEREGLADATPERDLVRKLFQPAYVRGGP